ncbi:MAG: MmgE/PrpD family protein [Silicimonas sp.]|nr:MmgE/PrpD family protein [Silicimonas sp.]
MTIAALLSAFATAPMTPSDRAARMIRLSCLDWAACALAGRGEPLAGVLRGVALGEGGRAEAGLFGGGRGPARAAALVNGAISHALDYDDTHFAHIGHPSVAVFPAALAVAEREGHGMGAMLEAALLGVEASIRCGLWLGRGHYQVGYHQTATAGAFGATLAAARLCGLSAEETGHALGLAATKAAGLKAQFGTMGKPLNAGLAAECGVMAADWARAGLRSNPGALEGENGFGATHHGADARGAFDGLGETWAFETISHKFHACCHGLHGTLEAMRGIEGTPGQLVIHTHPRWLSVCNIPMPKDGLEAKFSYRMVAAMALAGIDTGEIGSFSDDLAQRADLAALMARVEVVSDDHLSEMQARVLADGVELSHDLAAPMTLETRAARLSAKAEALTGQGAALEAAIAAEDLGAFRAQVFGG